MHLLSWGSSAPPPIEFIARFSQRHGARTLAVSPHRTAAAISMPHFCKWRTYDSFRWTMTDYVRRSMEFAMGYPKMAGFFDIDWMMALAHQPRPSSSAPSG